jgi:hypothetical protein
MKKLASIICALLSLSLSAQNTAKNVFSTNEIVWYGLSFTEAKMVGQFDQAMGAGIATAAEIRNKWMSAWNGLIIAEPQNYKLKEAFEKESVFYDIGPSEKANQAIKTDNLMAVNPFTFADAQKSVKSAVSKLSGGEKSEGVGVVFVVESFNKNSDEATVYVTVFDIKTKAILITEKIIGKPAGIALRNYWAGAMKHVIKQIHKEYYSKWKAANK